MAEHPSSASVSQRRLSLLAAAAPPEENSGKDGRLGALDALRGGAMLLGVFLHAALSYVPHRPAGLVWGVCDERTSPILDALFWWIHAFRLPLFFVLAGFFAVLLYERHGTRGFLAHRARRLLVPFLAGSMLLLPLCLVYFWACGQVNGHGTVGRVRVFQPSVAIRSGLVGPFHLWFLQDLLLLSGLFAALRWLSGKPTAPAQGKLGPGGRLLFTPLLLAVPTALLLWEDCSPVLAQNNSFVPDFGRLLYFGYFFAIGTLLYQYRRALPQVFARPGNRLSLSLLAGTSMLLLLPLHLSGQLEGVRRLAFVMSIALLAWLSIFGLAGLALRYFSGHRPVAGYLADASYWVYLVHLPLVCTLQFALCRTALAPELKCLLVMTVAAGLSLVSYHALVRFTFLGKFLHGPRGERGNGKDRQVEDVLPGAETRLPRAAA
jgi:peptidoglycan/LPS O-acetylase OafA/YrhL